MTKLVHHKTWTACALFLWFCLTSHLSAQSITSASLSGFVADATNTPVAGATVRVVHVPTNTTYTGVTTTGGRFTFPGVQVGGPFNIVVLQGENTIAQRMGVETRLGENVEVRLTTTAPVPTDDVVQLERFEVVGEASELDPGATGSSTVASAARINLQPSVSRSFNDIIRTNPYVSVRAGQQLTALGLNNRYNSITLDGARLNDQFGLAPAGLFSLRNPFSLEAVEQISVAITPYDVTQSGFGGAAVNVVSKSGTNTFSGSFYTYYTDEDLQGEDVSLANAGRRPVDFSERTQGFTLGGPIIRDRLFFFVNFEEFLNPSGAPATPGFFPSDEALTIIKNQVAALPGSPDLGDFGGAGRLVQEDSKRLFKVDWNINSDHRLTVRYSDTKGTDPRTTAFSPGTGFSGPTVPNAPSTGYNNGITSFNSQFFNFETIEEVWAGQLFSTWTPDLTTEFSYSRNDSSNLRVTPVTFPEIRILNVPGTSNTAARTPINSSNALTLGTDVSSQGNGIIIEGLTYSALANYTWNDFTFRAGFDREEADFENLFRSGSYGVFAYNYSPTLNLTTDQPLGWARGVAEQNFPGTDISGYEQTGYFAQVRWQPTARLSLTAGLRFDEFSSPIAPGFNAKFSQDFNQFYPGIRNDGTLDGADRLAPRFSFNYAIDEDRLTQVRGGAGVFAGRNPWVWFSNSYGNTGFGRFPLVRPTTNAPTPPTLGQYLQGTYSDPNPAFRFDAANPLGATNSGPESAGSVVVNLVDRDIEVPTNLRYNLAVDRRLPFMDAVVTVEYIHNDVIKAMFYENLNLRVFNGTSMNQPTSASYGADGRLRFNPAATRALVTGYGQVIRVRNIDQGSSDYASITLDRPFKNSWAYNVSYTRGRAREAQPSGSSTAGSNWSFNIVKDQGQIELARADYEVTDRVQASISKQFRFVQRLVTTLSLYYEGRTGQPFSYVYGGDLNSDGSNNNDLFYVPTGVNDPKVDFSQMSEPQRNAYFKFINENGLSKYAGGHAPRNAFSTSWQNRLDLRFNQEVHVKGPLKIDFFADFLNFGSWLSDDVFNYIELLNTSSTNSNQLRAVGSATYGADGRLVPTATTTASGDLTVPAASQFVFDNGVNRWRIQTGFRISF